MVMSRAPYVEREVQGYLCMEEGAGSQAVELAGGDVSWMKLCWGDGQRRWDLERTMELRGVLLINV